MFSGCDLSTPTIENIDVGTKTTIVYGDSTTVTCAAGYSLKSGNDNFVITCDGDNKYTYSEVSPGPECMQSMSIKLLFYRFIHIDIINWYINAL